LGHGGQAWKGAAQFLVPERGVTEQIVGPDHFPFPFLGFGREGLKGFDDVELAIIVGQLFAGEDVADGKLQAIGGEAAVGMEAVVEVAAVVPAENIVALLIAETVGQQDVPVFFLVPGQFRRGDFPVEGVPDPGDGAQGD
jgi:hypothetical protein